MHPEAPQFPPSEPSSPVVRYEPHLVRDYVRPPTSSEPSVPFLFPSVTPALVANKPVVVLINRGTASSAEVFTAALHDHGRAVVLGERSFGKSLIQHVFPLVRQCLNLNS